MSNGHYPQSWRFADDEGQAAYAAVPTFTPHPEGMVNTLFDGQRLRHRVPMPRQLLASHLELGPLLTAPGSARLHARAVLGEWGMAELAEVTELLVTELTTNAVTATRALVTPLPVPVRLWLHGSRKRVLVTVWDADPQPPALQSELPTDAESGRGLMLVDALSSQWGWYEPPVMGGKCVWCEIPRPSAVQE